MINVANHYALLDPNMELSSDELELVLGGNDPSGAQQDPNTNNNTTTYGPPPPPLPTIDVGRVDISINVEANATKGFEDLTEGGNAIMQEAAHSLHVGHEIVESVANSDTAAAADNFFASAFNAATEFFFGGGGSGG